MSLTELQKNCSLLKTSRYQKCYSCGHEYCVNCEEICPQCGAVNSNLRR